MADDWLVVSPSGSISSVKSLNLYGSDLSINEWYVVEDYPRLSGVSLRV